jgi:Na+/phosphate symporter
MTEIEQAIANLKDLVECRCDEAYTGRYRHDPHSACDYADEVKIVADHIEEIGAQLKMALEREAETQARHDSKMDALEAKLAKAVAALQGAVSVCQRAINGYAAKMQSSTNKAEGRDWQTMLFAALDIKHAIIENIPADVAALDETKGETK